MAAGLMQSLLGTVGGASGGLAMSLAAAAGSDGDDANVLSNMGELTPVLESVLLDHLQGMEQGERPTSSAAAAALPRVSLHGDAPIHAQLPQKDVLTLHPGAAKLYATVATFSAPLPLESATPLRMRLVTAEPNTCAHPLLNEALCSGAAVVCDRGAVTFASKAATAAAAGAQAVIVVNSEGVWPLQMSDPSGELAARPLALHAVMISAGDGATLKAHMRSHGVASECTLVRTCDAHSCAVCMDAFTPGEKACLLPCGHPFHDACVGVWLSRSNTCPVCRHALPPATDEEMLSARVQGMDDVTRARVMAMARAMTRARAAAQRDRAHAQEREQMLSNWYA